jgi:IS5 family transposase
MILGADGVIALMKQMSLGESGFERKTKRTRKREFLDEMNLVVPWRELVAADRAARASTWCQGWTPTVCVETMLRIHFMQQWFNSRTRPWKKRCTTCRCSGSSPGWMPGHNLPDESTILRFRHLLEAHALSLQILATINATLAARGLMLKSGTVVDATLIAAPSSTKNSLGERDPEMHQTRKGNQWYFGMKAHIGVDAESGLVHTVLGTAANVNDVTQATRWCTERKPSSLPTRATRGGQARETEATGVPGTWRCARANARRSTRARRWARCWTSSRSSRRASGPRSNTRSG